MDWPPVLLGAVVASIVACVLTVLHRVLGGAAGTPPPPAPESSMRAILALERQAANKRAETRGAVQEAEESSRREIEKAVSSESPEEAIATLWNRTREE